jgi:hypothetical protein
MGGNGRDCMLALSRGGPQNGKKNRFEICIRTDDACMADRIFLVLYSVFLWLTIRTS